MLIACKSGDDLRLKNKIRRDGKRENKNKYYKRKWFHKTGYSCNIIMFVHLDRPIRDNTVRDIAKYLTSNT